MRIAPWDPQWRQTHNIDARKLAFSWLILSHLGSVARDQVVQDRESFRQSWRSPPDRTHVDFSMIERTNEAVSTNEFFDYEIPITNSKACLHSCILRYGTLVRSHRSAALGSSVYHSIPPTLKPQTPNHSISPITASPSPKSTITSRRAPFMSTRFVSRRTRAGFAGWDPKYRVKVRGARGLRHELGHPRWVRYQGALGEDSL